MAQESQITFIIKCEHIINENTAIGGYFLEQTITLLCSQCFKPNVAGHFLIQNFIDKDLSICITKIGQQQQLLQKIGIFSKALQQLVFKITKNCETMQSSNKMVQEQLENIKVRTFLTDDDYRKLFNNSNKINNIGNNIIFQTFNDDLENILKCITGYTARGSQIDSALKEMQNNESPSSLFDSSAYEQLKLNQCINREVLKLKQNIINIFPNIQNNLQFRKKLQLFNHQDQSNNYCLKDIEKFFNDISEQLEANSRSLQHRQGQQQEQQNEQLSDQIQQINEELDIINTLEQQQNEQLLDQTQQINEELGIINTLNIDQHQEEEQLNEYLPHQIYQNNEEQDNINTLEQQLNEYLPHQIYQNNVEPGIINRLNIDQSSDSESIIQFTDDESDHDSFYGLQESLE